MTKKRIQEKLIYSKIKVNCYLDQLEIVRLLILFDCSGAQNLNNKDVKYSGSIIHSYYIHPEHISYDIIRTKNVEMKFFDHKYDEITLHDLLHYEALITASPTFTGTVTAPTVSDKMYLVFVDGKSNPKCFHNSIESANTEAIRLSGNEVGKTVSVCEVVQQYKSEVVVNKIK